MYIEDITQKVFKHHKVDIKEENNHSLFIAWYEKGYTIVKIQDQSFSFEDIIGDCFNPLVNTNLSAAQLKKEEKAEKQRIADYGVFGCGLALNSEPVYDSFIWGFIADDFIGSGYDSDLLEQMKGL